MGAQGAGVGPIAAPTQPNTHNPTGPGAALGLTPPRPRGMQVSSLGNEAATTCRPALNLALFGAFPGTIIIF